MGGSGRSWADSTAHSLYSTATELAKLLYIFRVWREVAAHLHWDAYK